MSNKAEKPSQKKRKNTTSKTAKAYKVEQKSSDSSTEVNYRLDEPRVSVGFKCNKRLWKAFVQFSRREYNSVCYVLEPIMVALMTSKVNQSRTIKPLCIENLNITRVVKRVRRYSEEVVQVRYCEVIECDKIVKDHLLDSTGRSHYFCRKHADYPLRMLGFVRVPDG